MSASLQRLAAASGASYSAAVAASGDGRWVYISGHIGRDVLAGLGAQAESCFDQIGELLRGLGGSLADVVRITAYLTSLDEYADYNRARGAKFQGSFPASTAVQVAGLLAGAAIEIDAVAFVPT